MVENDIKQAIASNENSDKIFDIIQSLQEKLQSFNNDDNVKTSSSFSNENNNYNNTYKDEKLGNQTDFNFGGVDSLGSILSNLNISPGTIMKFQRAFSALNQTDPRKNLLTSLKPFLRETRKKNIDTYITFLGVINAIGVFGNTDL